MPLRIGRAIDFKDQLSGEKPTRVVMSGDLLVGTMTRVRRGNPQAGQWAWKMVVPVMRDPELLERQGIARTQAEAQERIREGFRAWLRRAHLVEREQGVVPTNEYQELARNAKAALDMIREAVEQNAPPGSVPGKLGGIEPTVPPLFWEADAIVTGILALVRNAKLRK